MMNTLRRVKGEPRSVWVLVLVSAMAGGMSGCSWFESKQESEPGPSMTVTSPAGEPVVVVEGELVFLDGTLMGSTRAVPEAGRLQKIDVLFNALKLKREAFRMDHPDLPFDGRAVIAAEEDVSGLVLKSVFQTIAYAGYPTLLVKTSNGFVEVGAQVPGPPVEEGLPVVDEVGIWVDESTVRLTHEQGGEMLHERKMALPEAEKIAALVNDALVKHFVRRDVAPHPVPTVVMHFSNDDPSALAAATCDGAAAAQLVLSGPDADPPAFRIILSMR